MVSCSTARDAMSAMIFLNRHPFCAENRRRKRGVRQKNVTRPPELKMQFQMKLGRRDIGKSCPRCLGQEIRKSVFANGADNRLKVRSLLVAESCPAKPPVSQCQSQQSRACGHPGGYTSTTRRFLLSLLASTFALATSYLKDLGDLPYANSL